jgi:shikimate dehydrogenase
MMRDLGKDAMPISGGAKLAGVMGWPVAHSLSPRLHGYWLEHHGIDGAYVPLAVRPEHFADALRALPKLGFAGANVTVPHKETACALVDTLDGAARRIGAVNTIVVGRDGRIEGRNTDGFGFMENLRHGAPAWQASAAPAVVLGAGGAARAVCWALLDAGATALRLVNRTPARAQALAEDIGGPIAVIAWSERDRALEGAGLLVNTTTLGMRGAGTLAIDLAGLPPAAVVADIVYAPLETPLLKAAAARGHPAVDGLGMLLHQARPGFAAWFGPMPEVTDDLRAVMLAGLKG